MDASKMNPPALNSSPGLEAFFAVFGKHPTAADHIEDLGLATPALAAFKQQFYVNGLGVCIARSVWSQELPSGAAPPYDHGLLTVDANGWIAARFVSSRDATGRAQYPLVVCLQGLDGEDLRASGQIWPWLEARLDAALEANTPERLRRVFAEGQETRVPGRFETLPSRSSWGSEIGEGLMRVAHALSPAGASVNRARVPLGSLDAGTSALFWTSFLSHLQPVKAITIVWQAKSRFADLMTDAPQAALFHTLFSPESKVPLTTSVPFSVSTGVSRHTASVLSAWQSSTRLFAGSAPNSGELPFFEKLARDFRGWLHS
jgi:hypothetical protein